MAVLVRQELLAERLSDDVRAVVEAAGLRKAHARASYSIRLGETELGTLSSTVVGGQEEEQLAYVLRGEIRQPQAIHLRGFVLAGWDRRLERVALEADLGDRQYRLDGRREPVAQADGAMPFEFTWHPAGDAPPLSWLLPDAPLLAPGPLPLPELATTGGGAGAAFSGTVVDPGTGGPATWEVGAPTTETLVVAGSSRRVERRVLRFGTLTATAWTEPTGFPVRIDLPMGASVILVEDTRR